MILILAVILGFVASLARHRGHVLDVLSDLPLRWVWLAFVALALQVPLLRASGGTPGDAALEQALFLASYLPLFAFALLNRWAPGLWLVGLGAACNLVVIAANGGWMPVHPETLALINPGTRVENWPVGFHYGYSKDLILARDATHLWWLSDIVVLPPPFPWPAAASAGDLLIAVGVFALLQGGQDGQTKQRKDNDR